MPRGLKNKQRRLLEDMGFHTAKINRQMKYANSRKKKRKK